MRATKYVLVAAGIVAVFVTIAWFLRDNLIQRISNPLLDDYGISVTDVSLDALAASDASIGYLELVHDKGTTIAIEDLTLPFGTTRKETKIYTAKKVTIVTATRRDGELFELAQLIHQLISLPDNLGDSKVAVAEFSLPPYPPVYDLHWELTDTEQRLRGSIASILMSLTITRTDATNHNVVFSLAGETAPLPGQFVTANLQQGDHDILIGGTSSIDLPTWEPVAKLSGIMLPAIEITSGTATLRFDIEIPHDASRSPTLAANVEPIAPLGFNYATRSDEIASIAVESASPVEIAATLATVDWSLQLAQTSLRANYGEWRDIPLSVSNLTCQSGPTCWMGTQVILGAAELPIGKVDRLEFVSTEQVLFPDAGPRIDVQPGATLNVKGLAIAATNVDEIEAQLVSTASLELLDAGWQLAASSLDAETRSVSVSDDVSVTASLFFENVVASELDDRLSASSGIYASSSQATLNEQSVALPGFKGDISLQDSTMSIDLVPVGLYQDGIAAATHDIAGQAGSLTVSDVAVSFQAKSLSSRVSPWPNDRDLIAGTVALDLDASWARKNSSIELDAQASIDVTDLAGFYADNAFTGLSTKVNVAYGNPTGFVAEPATISVALIDTGLLVENLSGAYALNLNAMSVDIENLQMSAFGGTVRADPFSFRTERERNTLTLRAESVDLTELLSLNEFETIEVSGSIGATLPVTIEGDTVTIENGTLTGDPAGGVIRYTPLRPPDESDASAIGLASRALSNFEFDTLSSDVNLTREGDLNLKLRLTGRNPTLNEKRPVVLNLGVENNIPQMLKSLRAARAVEDILEKRLNQ